MGAVYNCWLFYCCAALNPCSTMSVAWRASLLTFNHIYSSLCSNFLLTEGFGKKRLKKGQVCLEHDHFLSNRWISKTQVIPHATDSWWGAFVSSSWTNVNCRLKWFMMLELIRIKNANHTLIGICGQKNIQTVEFNYQTMWYNHYWLFDWLIDLERGGGGEKINVSPLQKIETSRES